MGREGKVGRQQGSWSHRASETRVRTLGFTVTKTRKGNKQLGRFLEHRSDTMRLALETMHSTTSSDELLDSGVP